MNDRVNPAEAKAAVRARPEWAAAAGEVAAWEADVATRAAERLRARRPPAYSHDGHLDPRIRSWVYRVANGEFVNLVVVGEVGRVKTWSCWEAAIRLVAAGFTGNVEFADALDLRERINRDVDYPWLNELARAGLLMIDDLGAFGQRDDKGVTRLSPVQEQHVGGVLHRRWEQRRPTVITSNEDNIKALVGDRSASRLADSLVTVPLLGPDRRRVKGGTGE